MLFTTIICGLLQCMAYPKTVHCQFWQPQFLMANSKDAGGASTLLLILRQLFLQSVSVNGVAMVEHGQLICADLESFGDFSNVAVA